MQKKNKSWRGEDGGGGEEEGKERRGKLFFSEAGGGREARRHLRDFFLLSFRASFASIFFSFVFIYCWRNGEKKKKVHKQLQVNRFAIYNSDFVRKSPANFRIVFIYCFEFNFIVLLVPCTHRGSGEELRKPLNVREFIEF